MKKFVAIPNYNVAVLMLNSRLSLSGQKSEYQPLDLKNLRVSTLKVSRQLNYSINLLWIAHE